MHVAIISDSNSSIQQEFVDEIKDILDSTENSLFLLKTLDINHPDFKQQIQAKEIDYLIVSGLKPASVVLDLQLSIPILYTLIPQLSFDSLIKKNDFTHPQQSVIFLDQSAVRKLALIEVIMGEKSSIGVLSANDSHQQALEFQSLANRQGIELIEERVKNPENLLDHIKSITKKADVIQAIYDREILNSQNAKWLLYIAYKMRKPVFAFSANFTKAGAIASIFSNSKQIAVQSIEWLNKVKNQKTIEKYQYPKDFDVSINHKLLNEFRLKEKSEAQIKAAIILQENQGNAHD